MIEHMSSTKYALIAAAAAMAVSACSGTAPAEPKPWPSAGAGPVAAAPTSAVVKPAWKDVTVTLPTDANGGQYGSAPFPGITLGQHQYSGKTQDCTAGPAVTDGS